MFYCRSQEIVPGDDVVITNPTYQSILKFEVAKRRDTAIYTITVTNEFGSDTADLEVVVMGR